MQLYSIHKSTFSSNLISLFKHNHVHFHFWTQSVIYYSDQIPDWVFATWLFCTANFNFSTAIKNVMFISTPEKDILLTECFKIILSCSPSFHDSPIGRMCHKYNFREICCRIVTCACLVNAKHIINQVKTATFKHMRRLPGRVNRASILFCD